MSNNSPLIALGVLGKPYKLLGEIYFFPYNINSEISFKGMDVLIGKNENSLDSMYIDNFNCKSNILKFNNVDSKELAVLLSKKKLYIYRDQMPDLLNDEYYLVDLIGCIVVSNENKVIGTVKDVMPLPANDVIVVEKNKKEHLIPLIDDVVKLIDIKNNKIEIIVIPGLL